MGTSEIIPYSPEAFDEKYYRGGAPGAFKPGEYTYDNPDQQTQLGYKWGHLQAFEPYDGILFVACALGFEVRYFWERGKRAYGIDVSQYAIENGDPAIRGRLFKYDGWQMENFREDHFQVVACFDMLSMPPSDLQEKIIQEMVRVAQNGICIRVVVKNYRNLNDPWDATDGVSCHYSTFERYDRLFTQSGKFRLKEAKIHCQYETVFWFTRV